MKYTFRWKYRMGNSSHYCRIADYPDTTDETNGYTLRDYTSAVVAITKLSENPARGPFEILDDNNKIVSIIDWRII